MLISNPKSGSKYSQFRDFWPFQSCQMIEVTLNINSLQISILVVVIWFPVKVMHGRHSYGPKYPFFIFVHKSIYRYYIDLYKFNYIESIVYLSCIQDYVENVMSCKVIQFWKNSSLLTDICDWKHDLQNFFKCSKLVLLT